MTEKQLKILIDPIIIARIRSINKHENADLLTIIELEVGEDFNNSTILSKNGTVQIVTAAKNITVGDFVPYLPPGNVVPGWLFFKNTEIRLESRPMRGVISHGMILAEDEIGIGEDHQGIFILNENIKENNNAIGKSIFKFINEQQYSILKKSANIVEITDEIQKKINLIKSVGSTENGGEIIGEDELIEIFASDKPLYSYDGFEPSGQMHIAQGVIRAINTNKMILAGFKFKMLVADWFGYLNNKMGGDIEKIKIVGKYFIEIWKAVGMDLDNTEFIWTSDIVKDSEYWEIVMQVSRTTTLKRILRTTEIMGRTGTDNLSASQILYPAMQIADIFHVVKCQVTELGLDQRKVNMLAREIGEELGYWKPVVVSHGMLQGLQKPLENTEGVSATERAISMKMSKSKPETAVFMTDTREAIESKIQKAYCPEGVVENNPILAYCKQIIFESHYLKRSSPLLEDGLFVIKRADKFGGDLKFETYKELESEYIKGGDFVHPADLKGAVVDYLDKLIEPVRDHFTNNAEANSLLEKVKSFQITR